MSDGIASGSDSTVINFLFLTLKRIAISHQTQQVAAISVMRLCILYPTLEQMY